MTGTVISYPIPAYQNLPIEPQFYQPSRFVIEDIGLGSTTTVTTETDHNYVIGQLVRLLVPDVFGTIQLNGREGYVISVPSDTQVVIDINSNSYNTFKALINPSTITDISSEGTSVTITTANTFVVGSLVTISAVVGLIEINGLTGRVNWATPLKISVAINSFGFSAYVSGGIVTLLSTPIVSQILAIGDITQGATNSTGLTNQGLYPLGTFINISPQ